MNDSRNTYPSSSAQRTEPRREHSLAAITLLYESRDGRLCLFEDAAGHLTAVRAERLA